MEFQSKNKAYFENKNKSMAVLARDKNLITYIYNSESRLGRQILGYLEGTKKNVETIDIAQENLGDTIWVELAEDLGVPLGHLFATGHADAPDFENTDKFDTSDWLKLVNQNPVVLQRPIVVNGKRVKHLSNRSEILQFFGVDSAGLKKTMAHEPPTTSSTTEDEHFIE